MGKSSNRYATHADYQQVFKTDAGQRVVWHLMKMSGVLVPSMSMTKPDALAMAFNDGRRSVVLDIMKILALDIKKAEAFIKKQQEKEQDEIIL